jgi:hypothetical protein
MIALNSWSDPGAPARRLPGQSFFYSLRGLAVDAAYLRSLLDTIEGPVILVSHAYGRAVITQAGNDPKVKGLVYTGFLCPATSPRPPI